FDDRRYADEDGQLPIATTGLVEGTGDYLFDDEFLAVTQVFAKDPNGVFNELTEQDDKNDPEAYLQKQSQGTPKKYELVGSSIVITPTPNYTSEKALKVTFKRNGKPFLYTDGAITPGIPSLFHPYLARHASYPYLIENNLSHARDVR